MLNELFKKASSLNYDDNIVDILRLIRSENVGPKTFFALLNLFGSAKSALENVEEFSVRGGRSKAIKVFSHKNACTELELLKKNNARIISYMDSSYSNLLREIPDLPPILSYKGNVKLLSKPAIAIVGARNSSINGQLFTEKIAKGLVQQHYVVVSGLARGIDTAAHKASTSQTIAVLAGGIDHIYPPENHRLYNQIVDEGGLIIAELPIGSNPLSKHFPQRNRIISGLSVGTVIVEATLNSGSLITARFALEQNREIFAVPGFPLDPRSNGTNKLIKEGAYLIESIEDIIANIPDYGNFTKKLKDFNHNSSDFKSISCKYINQIDDDMRKIVMNLLSSTPINIDHIIKMTDLPASAIYIILLELELAGNIARCPGNKFCLTY